MSTCLIATNSHVSQNKFPQIKKVKASDKFCMKKLIVKQQSHQSWHSGHFQTQRIRVRIQPSEVFLNHIYLLLTV